jgi:hypothetical protein
MWSPGVSWKPTTFPRKLNPDVITAVESALADGLTQDLAADSVGVTRETLRLWKNTGETESNRRQQGEQPDEMCNLHVELYLAFARARASVARTVSRQILGKDQRTAYTKDGDAYETDIDSGTARVRLTFLERRFPDQFQERVARELTGKDGKPFQLQAEIKPSQETQDLVRLYFDRKQ